MDKSKLKRIDDVRWEIPKDRKSGMKVPARIFASKTMMDDIDDSALDQISNAACLPGVVKHALAMPDIHSGYGLPIGGVMATDPDSGIVSPGAAGYDINCGVRLMRTPLSRQEIAKKLPDMADWMKAKIPCGVGVGGRLVLSKNDFEQIARSGAGWAVNKGYGIDDDLHHTEAHGRLKGADIRNVSHQAVKRGRNQAGTLGSGNHFCEIQYVDEIFDYEKAQEFGLEKGQVMVMIHSGSRGFGHQVATDYLKVMEKAMAKYQIIVPDRQLACAPVDSPEGRDYLSAMNVAANFAWTNRQILMQLVREIFAEKLGITDYRKMGLIYDVAHNIIKLEEHDVNGKMKKLMVHRKGATRAFPPGHPELAETYRQSGQPVIVPGDMGRMSFLLAGAPGAMEETFGSTCHGAGRRMSRHKAIKAAKGRNIGDELARLGIEVRARGRRTLEEEMPEAYKDVSEVVDVVEKAGLAVPVARLKPMAVIKG